jgi:hypothetical protein
VPGGFGRLFQAYAGNAKGAESWEASGRRWQLWRKAQGELARPGVWLIVAGRGPSPVVRPDAPHLVSQALHPDAFRELADQILADPLRGGRGQGGQGDCDGVHV